VIFTSLFYSYLNHFHVFMCENSPTIHSEA